MSDKNTMLVVSAHSADFVWRAGGAIAHHATLGYDVTVVCLSYGERGESAKFWKRGDMTMEQIKSERRKEAEAAAQKLAVHDIQFFDLGDYPLEMDRDARYRLVDVMRSVQPESILTHSKIDPYNADHAYAFHEVLKCRAIAQAWGHNPGEKVLGAPQVYLFEPHQPEQMEWKPDVFLDISDVWEQKRAAIECMNGQEHLWTYYTNLSENRANHFRRNSGGQAGGRDAKHAEGFQTVFPRTVDQL